LLRRPLRNAVVNIVTSADAAAAQAYAKAGVDACAMELLPRITRAQSMDVLSSQANLAGYRAVIEGAVAFDRGFPMLMTAAGTVPAANVFVMGAGVAGLQAIATGRRLGGRVSATDVRPAAKEEIKSLGASFIGHEDAESRSAQTAGGYARQLSAEFYAKQAEVVGAHIARQDVVICTALVQGRPWTDAADFAKLPALRAAPLPPGRLGVVSHLFEIESLVQLDRALLLTRTRVSRDEGGTLAVLSRRRGWPDG